MRALLVVILHELSQNGHEVSLVQCDDVIEALSPQGANHSLHNGVITRRQLPAVAAIRSDSVSPTRSIR